MISYFQRKYNYVTYIIPVVVKEDVAIFKRLSLGLSSYL